MELREKIIKFGIPTVLGAIGTKKGSKYGIVKGGGGGWNGRFAGGVLYFSASFTALEIGMQASKSIKTNYIDKDNGDLNRIDIAKRIHSIGKLMYSSGRTKMKDSKMYKEDE